MDGKVQVTNEWLLLNKQQINTDIKEYYEGTLDLCGPNDDFHTISAKKLYESVSADIYSYREEIEAFYREKQYWDVYIAENVNDNKKANTNPSKFNQSKPKHEIYLQALINLAEKADMYDISDRDTIKKFAFLCVKYISLRANETKRESRLVQKDAEHNLNLMRGFTDVLGQLTPNEFIQIFPIEKEYRGHKYQCRDYITTIRDLQSYDMNTSIGDKILKFLWAYHNWDIVEFEVERMCAISDLRRCNGQMGLMEEFADKHGIDTYTLDSVDGYLINNTTGQITKVSKPKKRKPKQFKVIK